MQGVDRDRVVPVVKPLDEAARSPGTSRRNSFEDGAIQVLRQIYRRTEIQRRRAYSRHPRLAPALVINRSILYGSRATALIRRPSSGSLTIRYLCAWPNRVDGLRKELPLTKTNLSHGIQTPPFEVQSPSLQHLALRTSWAKHPLENRPTRPRSVSPADCRSFDHSISTDYTS